MKKLFICMVILHVASIVFFGAGSAWLSHEKKIQTKAKAALFDEENRVRRLNYIIKQIDDGEFKFNLIEDYKQVGKKIVSDYLQIEKNEDGELMVVRHLRDIKKSISLSDYYKEVEQELIIAKNSVKHENNVISATKISIIVAMIIIGIGGVFGVGSIVCFVLFILAMLDRMDALMNLHQIVKNEDVIQQKMISLEKYIVTIAANSSELNGNITELDKHLCAGINWFGENLPKLINN